MMRVLCALVVLAAFAPARPLLAQGLRFDIRLVRHSDTFTEVIQLDHQGQLLGLREVPDDVGLRQIGFFADAAGMLDLPLPQGFTHLEPQSLSENGHVVGYAGRQMGDQRGSLTGFVWSRRLGKSQPLSPLPGDVGSVARDISADGSRIVGYSTGANPPRMRPCVWSWQEDQQTWTAEVLPTIENYNPYLVTSGVLISPDGEKIVASITVARLPGPLARFDSSLMMWHRQDGPLQDGPLQDGQPQPGGWQRRDVCPEQPRLWDLNNRGTIVGTVARDGHDVPCLVTPDGEFKRLPLLEGDVAGVAHAINEQDLIVGVSDRAGPDGGPRAVVWRNEQVSPLLLPRNYPFAAARAINPQGQIAGYATEIEVRENPAEVHEKTVGYVWSPQPAEPEGPATQSIPPAIPPTTPPAAIDSDR